MLVDSHCHLDMLDLDTFEGGLEGVRAAAHEADVGHMLCVSVNLEDYSPMLALVEDCDDVTVSVGVHPNARDGHEPSVGELVDLAAHRKVVAIGETGLDYFRSEGELDWQRERFRTHIAAAKRCGKPLIIHTREAREDTLRIMEEENATEAGGVMHCFAENWDMARRAMDLGFYISFSGIVTFKSASELQEVARRVPADRMLVETDCPYLTPVPYRGRRNEPAHVSFVSEEIAGLTGREEAEVAQRTTENAVRLFGLSV